MRVGEFCHRFLAEFAYCTRDLAEYELWTRFYVSTGKIIDQPITRVFVNSTNQFVLVYSSEEFSKDVLLSSYLFHWLQNMHPRMKLMLNYWCASQINSNHQLYNWEIDHDQKRIYFLDLSSYQQKNHRKEVQP